MKRLLLFFFCYISPCSAELLEKIQAQVAEEMISLIDIKIFQKREKLDLIPDSLLFNSLYKNPQLAQQNKVLLLKPDSKNQSSKKNKASPDSASYKSLSQKELALNYLMAREMVWQSSQKKLLPNQSPPETPEPDITKVLKKKKGRLSSSQFLSRLKKALSISGLERVILGPSRLIKKRLIFSSFIKKARYSSRELKPAFFNRDKN